MSLLLERILGFDNFPKLPDTILIPEGVAILVTFPIPGAPGLTRTARPPTLTDATVPRPVFASTSATCATLSAPILLNRLPNALLSASERLAAAAPLVP